MMAKKKEPLPQVNKMDLDRQAKRPIEKTWQDGKKHRTDRDGVAPKKYTPEPQRIF